MRRAARIAALAAVAACGRPEPRLPALGPEAVIVAFGDSLTRGVGAAPGHGYPEVLAELTGRTVINEGVSGEVSAAGAARLPGVLDRRRPDLLILCHGGNDLLGRDDPESLEANLREMLRVARLRGIPVVLIGVPEPGPFPSSAGVYAVLADEYALPFERDVVAVVESSPGLKSDAVHPNADGYRKIAEAVHALLRSAGAL